MTLVYYDPFVIQHETGNHPENARRVIASWERLAGSKWIEECTRPDWEPARLDHLRLVHDEPYLEFLGRACESGGGRIEADTVVSRQSFAAARVATGAVVDAVERVTRGDDKRAFCLIRPPGHHALPNQAMGFCLFNHVAVAARFATQELKVERVLIVDWDVHHGNGTQAVFWEDGQVGFLSIHRYPFYPGSGRREETGAGAGAGMICNIPVEFGTPVETYHRWFREGLERLAARVRPQLVLISAGFDAHYRDPIGSLGLRTEDFELLTQRVVDIANEYAGGRAVSLLEGGYEPSALADCVATHVYQLHTCGV